MTRKLHTRLPGQSKQGYEYTLHLQANLGRRMRGLKSVLGVQEYLVLPVLEIGDWRPKRKVTW